MGVAKSRLVKELTLPQVIRGAMAVCGDEECDVLLFVADLLIPHSIRHGEQGSSKEACKMSQQERAPDALHDGETSVNGLNLIWNDQQHG